MATSTRVQLQDATRDRILAAALEVFAECGFDGARTRDIADRAGANLGLIKYYFNDKQQLWKAAVAHAFEELQAGFAERLPARDGAASPLAWLEQAVRQFVHFVARHPEFMRLMNDEAKRDSPRMRWLADRYVRPMSEVVRAHVESAQADGLVARVAPASLHYLVLGAAGLIFSQAPECKYVTGVDPTDPQFADRHADALIELLMPARRRRRSTQARPRSSRVKRR